jgi:hypothetical protein
MLSDAEKPKKLGAVEDPRRPFDKKGRQLRRPIRGDQIFFEEAVSRFLSVSALQPMRRLSDLTYKLYRAL